SDVVLAGSGKQGVVVAFNVKADKRTQAIAKREKVDIMPFRVIYKLLEDVEKLLVSRLEPIRVEEVQGEAVIQEIFDITLKGNKSASIAGSRVTVGLVTKAAKVRVLRGDKVLFTGDISSLKNVKHDISEATKGQEFGVSFDGFEDMKEGDILQSLRYKEIPQKLRHTHEASHRQRQAQPRHQPTHAHVQAFSRKWWLRRIRYYVPIVGWLPRCSAGSLATDIKAGFMVACLLIPQALSYSSLTHLQPAYGLYTALVPALVYGMLGTSRHLSMGPEALVSVLTGTLVKSQLKHLYAAYSPNTPPADTVDEFSAAVASAVALASGLCTFALGMFRFGFLDSMISESSLRGFISGAAIVVLIGQTRI
ncbi:translation initiation factor IF-2, partial [Coemansia thaxteri]